MTITLDQIEKNHIALKVCEKEYESPELGGVLSWLKKNRWSSRNLNSSVAGSQEITIIELTREEYTAYLVFETYQGAMLYTKPEFVSLFSEIEINT